MGMGFVLMFFMGPLAIVFAATASVILRVMASRSGRRMASRATMFPFVCLVWAGVIFVSYALVNEQLFHRDALIGDSWDCPLPNGYAISMIDVTDRGWVYNRRAQAVEGIADVSRLQLAGNYIAVDADHQGSSTSPYYLVDTLSGARDVFSNRAELRSAVEYLGFQLDLKPIHTIYMRYRFTWFDLLALALLVVPPLIVLIKGIQRGSRLALGSPSRNESGV